MKKIKDISEDLRPQAHYPFLVNGEWRDGKSKQSFATLNPATGEELATIAIADPEDVDDAVQAAWIAFPSWRKTSPQERSAILLKIADRLEAELTRFATLETLDNGKPIRESTNIDLPMAIDHFRYFAGVIRAHSDEASMINDSALSIVLSEPLGVIGQIIPWNFPLLMAAWKLAPALGTGNCVVIKPSEFTSITILELGRIINELVPAGVLNIVPGYGADTGQALLDHPGFSKLAFTGSTRTGALVAKAAADKLIPSTLELGGKSANIIFDDAQLDRAVEGATLAILLNQGQCCCAGSRLFVQKGIYDQFVAQLKQQFEAVNVGDPLDPETQMGTLISELQYDKVQGYLQSAQDEGATILSGGTRPYEDGYFLRPTIIVDVELGMRVECEEIFGPVVVVLPFETEDEVIDAANSSEYGLGGAVWTRDINRAIRVARAVHTGRMWVNTYNELPAHAPFGGYKKSGLGRETHKMILDAYTQKKNIYINTSEQLFGLY